MAANMCVSHENHNLASDGDLIRNLWERSEELRRVQRELKWHRFEHFGTLGRPERPAAFPDILAWI